MTKILAKLPRGREATHAILRVEDEGELIGWIHSLPMHMANQVSIGEGGSFYCIINAESRDQD